MPNSVKQKTTRSAQPFSIPDFRNLGTTLRVLLLVLFLEALYTLAQSSSQSSNVLFPLFAQTVGLVSGPLFFVLLIAVTLNPWLQRLPVPVAIGSLMVLAMGASAYTALWWPTEPHPSPIMACLWAFLVCAFTFYYFDYRARVFAPSVSEARLMALNARIRPHFLFNSLNAILGVMRTDLPRAEQAIEELAYLYRALMRENRDLVSLGQEMDICLHYLELERLRLGDRLQIQWLDDDCPDDALVPPLLLQPLIENAVYHGIEPSGTPATLSVRFARKGAELLIEISNPIPPNISPTKHQQGNKMAIDNIRERLMLFYDLEGRLEIEITPSQYRVRVRMPYRKSGALE